MRSEGFGSGGVWLKVWGFGLKLRVRALGPKSCGWWFWFTVWGLNPKPRASASKSGVQEFGIRDGLAFGVLGIRFRA